MGKLQLRDLFIALQSIIINPEIHGSLLHLEEMLACHGPEMRS